MADLRDNLDKKENIGILGGTFDPVHNGHLALGMACAGALSLSRIILIPTGTPPHKADRAIPAEHRLALCRLAAAGAGRSSPGEPVFSVSDIEVSRPGKSYTDETLLSLGEEYPRAEFFLIMGADMFVTLRQWNGFERLKSMAVFCGCPRAGAGIFAAGLAGYAAGLEQDGCRAAVVPARLPEISSSGIRSRLAENRRVTGLLPEPVENYIYKNGLYR